MKRGLKYEGCLTKKEMDSAPGIPSLKDLESKPLAVIECTECIPCNPCETTCPFGAITVGNPIYNVPVLDSSKCRGCGRCIPNCPGLAIFVVNMNYTSDSSLIKLPYEFSPLPEKGMVVDCLDRRGKIVTSGKVCSVEISECFDSTYVIGIEVKKKYAMSVRSIRM